MKKKTVIFGLLLGLTLTAAGCKNEAKPENGAQTESGTEAGSGSEQNAGYELADHVTLGEYKGIEYKEMNLEVTEEDVQKAIENFISEHPILNEVKDRAVKNGDTVSISYIGTVDGVAFEGGTGSTDDLVIGSGAMIPGFEEGIIGTTPGNTVSVDVTFPEAYRPEGAPGSDLNGAAAVFEITVNHIVEKQDPEYNEEFVKANSEHATMEEFENGIQEELVETKKKEAEDARLDEIFSQVMDNAEIKEVPEVEYQKYYDNLMNSYNAMAESTGMELKDFLAMYYGVTEDDLHTYADAYANNMASQALIFKAIAKEESLTVSDEEYQEGLDKTFESFSSQYESKEAFEEEMSELLRDSILFDKVMQFVVDQAVAVPAADSAEDTQE